MKPIDLSSYGFQEDEFLISGRANIYDWLPKGDYKTAVKGEGDYVTRMTIRRPADMSKFSGRVVVEIINPSALYDWTAMWSALWERFVANGDVYVGITSKPAVFPGMIKMDPERYGRLKFQNPVPRKNRLAVICREKRIIRLTFRSSRKTALHGIFSRRSERCLKARIIRSVHRQRPFT
ncbi:hypothetical protein HED63_20735 [Ochrobactrum cytisi]|nr:hypothetical protein [Brucella cytisi]